MTRLDRCLSALEQAREATQLPIATVDRYTTIDEDGNEVELMQPYWGDKPIYKPCSAELWNAWRLGQAMGTDLYSHLVAHAQSRADGELTQIFIQVMGAEVEQILSTGGRNDE